MSDLIATVQYIVKRSAALKDKFTNEVNIPVEFGCIFCQTQKEYENYTKSIEKIGTIAETTLSGFTYLLREPIQTVSGPLFLVKIRKPDPMRIEKGDADFNTDYENLKNNYLTNPKFELIVRDTFEYLRLSDSNFDVLTCFSNIPKSKDLGIDLSSLTVMINK